MNSGKSNNTRWWICLALLGAIGACYWRVSGFDFINYDDPDYVTENPMVRAGLTFKGIIWALTHFHTGNWHPLTWISHMLDCQLFGVSAGGPHIVNVLFHAANAIVLFLLLDRHTQAQWRSAVVAALFALHPLHVESVAWISERKDVLSTFFGLFSLLAYVRYVKDSQAHKTVIKSKGEASESEISDSLAPSGGEGRGEGVLRNPGEIALGNQRKAYAFALLFFTLSLLAKPMLVTLPFVMLLLDFWPLQRMENAGWRSFLPPQFRKLVWEKWPAFALAAASSVITFFAQKTGGAVQSMEHFPLSWRVTNAIISYFDYIAKACWPVDLAVFYPVQHNQPPWLLLIALAFLIATSIVAARTIKHWPFVAVGWFWFLGTLVPVIGLVQVGGQAMADRYSYFPFIGLFILVVWCAANVLGQKKSTAILSSAIAAVVLVIFAVTTISQLQYWKNSFVLFTHTLAVTRDNAPANNSILEPHWPRLVGTALAALGEKKLWRTTPKQRGSSREMRVIKIIWPPPSCAAASPTPPSAITRPRSVPIHDMGKLTVIWARCFWLGIERTKQSPISTKPFA